MEDTFYLEFGNLVFSGFMPHLLSLPNFPEKQMLIYFLNIFLIPQMS